MDEKRKPRSLFFPILLVVIGIFLLLTNLGYVEGSTWDILAKYWPLIFIVGGLDGLYRQEGWVGPLVSLGLGTILMLGNLDYLQWKGFDLLLRLWPVLLIAWGLDVAFSRHRSFWSTISRVALGLLLVAGILWMAVASPFGTGTKTESFTQSLDGATRSSISFANGAGEFTLTGNADQDLLLSGTSDIPNNTTLTPYYLSPQDGTSTYSLEASGVVVFPVDTTDASWNFKINSSIPVDLEAKMGAGNLVLDLSDTDVEKLDAQLGVGQIYITFPSGRDISGKVQNAVGETVLRFPKGSQVIIYYSSGLVSLHLPSGFSSGDSKILSDFAGDNVISLEVDQAVGSVVIERY